MHGLLKNLIVVAGHSDNCSLPVTLLLSCARAASLIVSAAGARSSETSHYSRIPLILNCDDDLKNIHFYISSILP